MDEPKGMRRGLTRYGDEAFALYLRKGFVLEGTIRKALKEGRLSRVARTEEPRASAQERAASTPRERSDADAACAQGVATKRDVERALAPRGVLPEAPVQFEAAQSVAKAGVLVALPALLSQGLVEVGEQIYGRLKNGYYGLTTMLLTFVFMALAILVAVKSGGIALTGEAERARLYVREQLAGTVSDVNNLGSKISSFFAGMMTVNSLIEFMDFNLPATQRYECRTISCPRTGIEIFNCFFGPCRLMLFNPNFFCRPAQVFG